MYTYFTIVDILIDHLRIVIALHLRMATNEIGYSTVHFVRHSELRMEEKNQPALTMTSFYFLQNKS